MHSSTRARARAHTHTRMYYLLLVHDNNNVIAPQCYVIRTLPVCYFCFLSIQHITKCFKQIYIRFEAVTTDNILISLWVVTSCSLVGGYQHSIFRMKRDALQFGAVLCDSASYLFLQLVPPSHNTYTEYKARNIMHRVDSSQIKQPRFYRSVALLWSCFAPQKKDSERGVSPAVARQFVFIVIGGFISWNWGDRISRRYTTLLFTRPSIGQ